MTRRNLSYPPAHPGTTLEVDDGIGDPSPLILTKSLEGLKPGLAAHPLDYTSHSNKRLEDSGYDNYRLERNVEKGISTRGRNTPRNCLTETQLEQSRLPDMCRTTSRSTVKVTMEGEKEV
jgi:hypothetical protein